MKSIRKMYGVNYPQVDPATKSFSFSTNNALGTFAFVFKWLNAQWNGWATLPSGEVRPFGCVPEVVGWTEFTDYGVVIDAGVPFLALASLLGKSRLYLIAWGVD